MTKRNAPGEKIPECSGNTARGINETKQDDARDVREDEDRQMSQGVFLLSALIKAEQSVSNYKTLK